MKHVAARLVPKQLNFLQKLNRIRVAEDMLERVNSDPTFMKSIVTGDETWVYKFDMQTSQQVSEWHLPTERKKPLQSRSKSSSAFVAPLVLQMSIGDGNRFPSSGPSACLLNSCNKKKLKKIMKSQFLQ
ncbi:hypothetical protein K1T71_005234 [Dendrolimus kikuchii]|uniref:Uncharacterized protein n=1 Tax=Dendrolimus kikuchii TaxID=765133 RepID=A0ACC1D6R5_9NEOP|nr:hypothetical protein K1T71_005234 [Dendrolimus kikuchii]